MTLFDQRKASIKIAFVVLITLIIHELLGGKLGIYIPVPFAVMLLLRLPGVALAALVDAVLPLPKLLLWRDPHSMPSGPFVWLCILMTLFIEIEISRYIFRRVNVKGA